MNSSLDQKLKPGTPGWYAQVTEAIIEPDRPIIDPHHHLWRRLPDNIYLLDEFWADSATGHNIEKTVFVQCRAEYRTDGPEHMKPVGETEFIAGLAEKSRDEAGRKPVVSAIVSFADLSLGDAVAEVLDGHEEAGRGLFRGVRQSAALDPDPDALSIPYNAPAGLYADAGFRAGMAALGERGLTFDAWHFHHQMQDFIALARAVPQTTMILGHFGTPLGVGGYRGRRAEIFETWASDIAELAKCPNVFAKLGGLAMPDNGFGWDKAARPATSDDIVAAQGAYYRHTIDCFGPDRCMFQSNFPADKPSVSYPVLWNAFKKIAAPFSETEQDALFRGTAARVYRL